MIIPLHAFYYLRHGETDWNLTNRIMGQTDIPLNKRGIEQSFQAKTHLNTIEFGKIWSSPLLRARQTAEIINEGFNVPIDYKNNLKERRWGLGEGESHDRFLPDMKLDLKGGEAIEEIIPEGAESYAEFEARIIVAFQEILTPEPKPPLVVGHGGVFQVLTNLLGNTTLPAENCALYYFKPPQPKSNLLPRQPWFIVNLRGNNS